jgi:membrane fusion protein (multidrug efflux system)
VQGKQIVYVVGKGNKVKSRIIETNGTSGLNFIVTNGLSSDEVVVIEGASKLKDDVEIIPQAIASEDAQSRSCPTCKIVIKSNNRIKRIKC